MAKHEGAPAQRRACVVARFVLFFPFPDCTGWSIKRYDMFLQTSPLISLGGCGSSPMAVADSLPAHREAATPPLCGIHSLPPVTLAHGKSSLCPVWRWFPLLFFFLIFLDLVLHCSAELWFKCCWAVLCRRPRRMRQGSEPHSPWDH